MKVLVLKTTFCGKEYIAEIPLPLDFSKTPSMDEVAKIVRTACKKELARAHNSRKPKLAKSAEESEL